MSDRARYHGPHAAVDVTYPDGTTVSVKKGGLLPDDAPATVRDDLLSAGWAVVHQPGPKARANPQPKPHEGTDQAPEPADPKEQS